MRRAKSSSKVRRSHNPRLWFSLSIVPLLVLLIDFALYPKFFKSRQRLPGIDANILINKPFVHLGTIDTVDFNVSLESLKESDSLGYFLKSHKSGFVTSVFIDLSLPEPERIFEGELLIAVRDRLRSASLVADQRLEEFIRQVSSRQPGDVVGIDLQLTALQRIQFPVDRLIIVVLNRPGIQEKDDLRRRAMTAVVSDAVGSGVDWLAIPALGYQPNAVDSIAFDQIFRPVFKAVEGTSRPMHLVFSLYSRWPTRDFENAVSSINRAWNDNLPSGLYRGRYRLLLLFVTICLIACQVKAEHSIKSFLLITAAYLGAAAGLGELVEFFLKNYHSLKIELFLPIFWAVLAIGFPAFLHWDVKEVFRSKNKLR